MARRPATVGHGEDLQGVAIRVVPVEPAAALGPGLVDALLLMARVGVRGDAVVGEAFPDLLELRRVDEEGVVPGAGRPRVSANARTAWLPSRTIANGPYSTAGSRFSISTTWAAAVRRFRTCTMVWSRSALMKCSLPPGAYGAPRAWPTGVVILGAIEARSSRVRCKL